MQFMMNNLVCLGLIFRLVILTSLSLKMEIVKKTSRVQRLSKKRKNFSVCMNVWVGVYGISTHLYEM